jgi:hypothetical protein
VHRCGLLRMQQLTRSGAPRAALRALCIVAARSETEARSDGSWDVVSGSDGGPTAAAATASPPRSPPASPPASPPPATPVAAPAPPHSVGPTPSPSPLPAGRTPLATDDDVDEDWGMS